MKDIKTLIQQPLNNLQTTAGIKKTGSNNRNKNQKYIPNESLTPIQAVINTIFTMLKAAYPLKFKQAFPLLEDQARAKKVWKQLLMPYDTNIIKWAAEKAMKESRFFPDIADITKYCQKKLESDFALKTPLDAYKEACYAKPQKKYPWSHIAVYIAAKETGWSFLKNEPENIVFPVFSQNYQLLCQRIKNGEDLNDNFKKSLHDEKNENIWSKINRKSQQSLHQDMIKLGIDPNGGREEFIKNKLLK